jgi:hypothetical protein
MRTRTFKLLRESKKGLKTTKNRNALSKKVHKEKEDKGE